MGSDQSTPLFSGLCGESKERRPQTDSSTETDPPEPLPSSTRDCNSTAATSGTNATPGGDIAALTDEQAALCAASPDGAPNTLDTAAATKLIDAVLGCGPTDRFVDTAFPADDGSVNRTVRDDHPDQFIGGATEWRRAWDTFDDPQLFVDGVNVHDVCQGAIGNCYMVSQIASAGGMHPDRIQALFHPQVANPQGIYGVRLWVATLSEWRMVIVDDNVPCSPGSAHLRFVRSSTDGELWPTLLEKALAKVHSSYQDLSAGLGRVCAARALLGGLSFIVCPSSPPEMWAAVTHCIDRRWALRTGTGRMDEDGQWVAVGADEGLVDGHAYSILRYHHDAGAGVHLLQLRNPWGGTEWTGAWGDTSPLWAQFPQIAAAVGFGGADDDGLFWISLQDFCGRFSGLHAYGVEDGAPLPDGANLSEAQYDWCATRHQRKANLEANKQVITMSDPGAPDSGTDVFAGPQFSLVVPHGGATIRAKADRVPEELSPTGGERGGYPTLYIFAHRDGGAKAAGVGAGRVVHIGKTFGPSEAEAVVSSMFLTEDLQLQEGRYTIVPFVANVSQWPVAVLLKSSVPLPVSQAPDIAAVPIAADRTPWTAADTQAVFAVTVAEPGTYVFEAATQPFDSFSHWGAMMHLSIEDSGGALVDQRHDNGATRVCSSARLMAGQYTATVMHEAFSGPLTFRGAGFDCDGSSLTIAAVPS